ncbi:MAG: GNAT family N-acetyltransferase [Rhizobiaceae bacterium]|nr:GNAT family N-acetyltransferase [Rhizobiaceae bacterium]
MSSAEQFKIQIIPSFKDVNAADWDQLIANGSSAHPNPFVTHAYLSALEESGSACVETGWLGQHLLLQDKEDRLLAALPCYLKNHSQGEYVFDHGWADAFERAGGRYYPKLQCSIPFTPATGPRLLTGSGKNSNEYRAILANGLKQLCTRHKVSSAHITFLPQDDWQALGQHDFLLRIDQQFHWQNSGYEHFSNFLETLSSRKRKNIRKEREAAAAIEGIEFEWIEGGDITQKIWDVFYEFYLDTGSRKWGRPYLTREFYSLIGKNMPQQIVLIMAKRNGVYIAGAINFIGDNCLFGRHWGCSEFHPALHFEICYYQAIEYAISHKIGRVEAGAQGEHKLARGYMPVTTHSAHWIENPGLKDAVANYLRSEREHVKMESKLLAAHGPFRKT